MRSIVLLAALFTASCFPVSDSAVEACDHDLLLKTYEVPAGYGDKMASVLRRVLPGDQASVSEGPNGEIVMVGSASLHEGVAELVASVHAGRGALEPPRNITVEYWAVWGSPAGEPGRDGALSPVSTALTAIEADAGGPMAFELMAKNTVISLDGHQGEIRGSDGFSVEHTATIDPGTGALIADISISRRGVGPQARVLLQPNQWLVIGEVGRPEEGTTSTLYYLARAVVSGG